jgi:hypothetical protein
VSQYIDDHNVTGYRGDGSIEGVNRAVYALTLIKCCFGGYAWSIKKSDFTPRRQWLALGMVVDREVGAFRVPGSPGCANSTWPDKAGEFRLLISSLLESLSDNGSICLATAARVAGKAISFMFALPSVRFFLNTLYIALTGRPLDSDTAVARAAISPWWTWARGVGTYFLRRNLIKPLIRDLQSLMTMVQSSRVYPWLEERSGSVVHIENDTTLVQNGSRITLPLGDVETLPTWLRELFDGNALIFGMTLPDIVGRGGDESVSILGSNTGTTELAGMLVTIQAVDRVPELRRYFENHRVTFWMDNLEDVLIMRGGAIGGLYSLAKRAIALSLMSVFDQWNTLATFDHVRSADNGADEPSRGLLWRSLRLQPSEFHRLWRLWGPFDLDAMSSVACEQYGPLGEIIPYLSRSLDPRASGIGVFAHDVSKLINLNGTTESDPGQRCRVYVNPPFVMLPAVLRHLQDCGAAGVLVLPAYPEPVPSWLSRAQRSFLAVHAVSPHSVQIRGRNGWEEFHSSPPLVAVRFDFLKSIVP